MEFKIPESLKLGHEELHEQLEATQVNGKIGEAAKTVAKLFHAHAEKESLWIFAFCHSWMRPRSTTRIH